MFNTSARWLLQKLIEYSVELCIIIFKKPVDKINLPRWLKSNMES
jgi:hypothetical protein